MDPIRSVLFVGRTMQATNRLYYDVLPLVAGDPRVQTYFTFDASSEFGDNVPRFLDRQQVKQIPWDLATDPGRFDCDVTVSASANPNLRLLPGRKLVMAHGAGGHRFRAQHGADEPTVSGLSPTQLVHDGDVIPSAIALSGSDPRHRLQHDCPEAADRAVVTGDVCAERLRLSLPHRHRYRRHLGLHPGQRLVVVSSTWGPHSLLRRRPRLADRLLAELPADEYRIAYILHPNGWDRHGRPDVHGRLATAKRAGLAIIPPEEGWRAAIVAGDLVIGDHGSVGFYAADLGRPLLYATFGDTEVPEDSPVAALGRVVPRLDPHADLAEQIETAVAHHDPERYRPITGRALEPEGSAAERMRAVLYRLLDLAPEGEAPRVAPLPPPEPEWSPATVFDVHPVPESEPLKLVRFPFTSREAMLARRFADRVLVADAAETEDDHRLAAAVLTWNDSELSVEEAGHWTAEQLRAYPGAAIAVAKLSKAGCLVRTRAGDGWLAESHARLEPASLGAALSLRPPRPDSRATVRFREGRRVLVVTLSPVEV